MLILRKSKLFASVMNEANQPDNPQEQNQQPSPDAQLRTSKDLLVEQMRLQKVMLQTQKQRQQLQAQENRDRLRQVQTAQRVAQKKEEQEDKNEIKRRKLEVDKGAKNVSLYKSRSGRVDPVPMKQ